MNYLLDTHLLLWSLLESDKINSKISIIIESPQNQIFVSALSFWEISFKFSLGKLELKETSPSLFPAIALRMGFKTIDLKTTEASNYHFLEGKWHRDSFDRMLIIQAIKNDLILITKDENIAKYA